MRGFSSKISLPLISLAGILGIWLISSDKMAFSHSSNLRGHSSNPEWKFQAEIIGDYFAHGVGGSVFKLPSGDVLKVVSLENDMIGEGGDLNRDQSAFIEDLWIKKMKGQPSFIRQFADIKHYHRGFAGPKMARLVNTESPAYEKRPLRVGEPIAYWVMEHIPTIGEGDMSDTEIKGGTNMVKSWGKRHGYTIHDLHPSNFGERADGSFVAFDPWPTKD
jgi:hypothetical protein